MRRSKARRAIFKDGTTKDVDAIILCTGYLHHHPFMEDSLRLKSRNRLYPPNPLQGHLLVDNPKLMYIGMQDQFYTFNMFDAQAWYARDVVLGRIKLPSKSEMFEDMPEVDANEEAIADASEAIDFQTEYVRDLHRRRPIIPASTSTPSPKMFKEWEHHKMDDILTYRDQSHRSVLTGTQAPIHHTPWMKALTIRWKPSSISQQHKVAAE